MTLGLMPAGAGASAAVAATGSAGLEQPAMRDAATAAAEEGVLEFESGQNGFGTHQTRQTRQISRAREAERGA